MTCLCISWATGGSISAVTDIQFDVTACERRAWELGGALDQVPFALAGALTDAAFIARRHLVEQTWPGKSRWSIISVERTSSFTRQAASRRRGDVSPSQRPATRAGLVASPSPASGCPQAQGRPGRPHLLGGAQREERRLRRAWIEINAAAPIDPLAGAAARERLGYIIVGIWKLDSSQDLASAAVRLFTSTADANLTAATDLAQSLVAARLQPSRRARP